MTSRRSNLDHSGKLVKRHHIVTFRSLYFRVFKVRMGTAYATPCDQSGKPLPGPMSILVAELVEVVA